MEYLVFSADDKIVECLDNGNKERGHRSSPKIFGPSSRSGSDGARARSGGAMIFRVNPLTLFETLYDFEKVSRFLGEKSAEPRTPTKHSAQYYMLQGQLVLKLIEPSNV